MRPAKVASANTAAGGQSQLSVSTCDPKYLPVVADLRCLAFFRSFPVQPKRLRCVRPQAVRPAEPHRPSRGYKPASLRAAFDSEVPAVLA